MRRTAILFVLAASLLLGCSKGTAKYQAPPKHYPILYTYAADKDAVWEATLAALAEMKFDVTSANKDAGRIETNWVNTGWAPARRCKYGFVNYVENPVRREKLIIEVKKAPLNAPPATFQPAAPPSRPGYPPQGGPATAPGYPPAAPQGYPGYPPQGGSPGDVLLAQAGFPPPTGGPRAGAPTGRTGTMVLIKSKAESVLDEECGGEPKVVEMNSDTTTEYRLLYNIGTKLGARMEPPQFR